MYIKEELTGIECDNCKDQYRAKHTDFSFFTDEGNAMESAWDDGWVQDQSNGKHYCPDCHTVDDEDNIILKKLSPIYLVIAEFPENKDFPKGKKIEFEPWTNQPDYWMHVVEDCQGRIEWLSGYFDNFPAIFKRLR